MKNNTLSVVIPCYNANKRIVDCINSIKLSLKNMSPGFEFEIIVVDDGSTDKTPNKIKKINDIKIITHSKNRGLSSARNSGINASQSEYIAFIDSDIIIEKQWFKKILTLLINNYNIAGVTGELKIPPSNQAPSLLDLYLFSNYRGIKNIDTKTPLLYKWFVFSNTIVRRNIFEKTDLFDENLISYGGEDTELAIRINKKFPNNLRKCSCAHAYHYSDKSLNQHRNNMFNYGLNNFNYILQKHPDYQKSLLPSNIIWLFNGYLIFNPINKLICLFVLRLIKHPLLIKFLVVYSFALGCRSSKKL